MHPDLTGDVPRQTQTSSQTAHESTGPSFPQRQPLVWPDRPRPVGATRGEEPTCAQQDPDAGRSSATQHPQGSTARIRQLLQDDPAMVEVVRTSTSRWKNRIFETRTLQVGLPDGSVDGREIVLHLGGAGVLAVQDGRMCLVRQYRAAIGRMTLEIPAGKLEPGEDPSECAARELQEETGLRAEHLEFVASSLSAPGFSNEKTRVFRAWGLSRGDACPDEGEYVDVAWLPVADVMAAIHEGLIEDGKTIVAAYDALARP